VPLGSRCSSSPGGNEAEAGTTIPASARSSSFGIVSGSS
jgi:hypothetical protein